MKLLDQTVTIGIELELYGSASAIRDKYILPTSGLSLGGDASLGNKGIEVKFDSGVPLKDSLGRIDTLHKLVNDKSLDSVFVSTVKNYIPKEVCDNIDVRLCPTNYEYGMVSDYVGTTGLHIHIGVPENVTYLDCLALAKYMSKNDKKVRKLSWRESAVWALDPKCHLKNINRVASYIEPRQSQDVSLYNSKYVGVNFRNVFSGFKTVEYRYADSTLLSNMGAFKKYLKFLVAAHKKYLIGRDTFKIDKDTTLVANSNRKHNFSLLKNGSEHSTIRFYY